MNSKGLTPHGPGFQFIDRFEKTEPTSGIGWKHLKAESPYFRDHFPNQPIMPAVLLVECAAQTAGVLVMQGANESSTPLFWPALISFGFLDPFFQMKHWKQKPLSKKSSAHLLYFKSNAKSSIGLLQEVD